MIIEKIVTPKRKKDAQEIHVAGAPPLLLHIEVIARHGLFAGQYISEEKLSELIREDELARCRVSAWRLIAIRPRSRLELTRALRQKKFMRASVEAVIADLAAKGYIDDAAFASLFARQRSGRQHGPALIEQELRAKGIERSAAKEIAREVSPHGQQEEDVAELLKRWNRRSKPDDPSKRRQAAAAFLLRRGYDSDLVWQEIRRFFSATDTEAE